MKQKIARKILTVTSMLLSGVMVTATVICNENATAISSVLNVKTFDVVETGDTNQDSEYYKSNFDNLTDLINAGHSKATEVLEEGAVLLKNENGALPLSKGSKVSLLGVTAYDPVYGGTGSGNISTSEATDFCKSLQDAGLEINPVLTKQYTSEDWAQYKRRNAGSYSTSRLLINEAPWSVVDAAAGDSLAQYGDAAIFVVGRVGGEGYDLLGITEDGIDNHDGLGKDYLGLNANEWSVLQGLKEKKAAGEISRIIVLINYSSMIEGDFLNDPDIDAALWVGALGVGNEATGKLLTGEVSPSGRLPDTMWVDNAKNPVNANFGSWVYENAGEYGISTEKPKTETDPEKNGGYSTSDITLSSYVVYQEGMYMGYRYTETRYEDYVLGTANVGEYNYDEVVARPFGYGLSYADFDLSDVKVEKSDDLNYVVTATVTNVSDTYSGKYSVPVYVSKPYGQYAQQNGVQVPSVELVGFEKTDTLAPGQSQNVTITLDEKYFTSYDAYNAKGYVLMDGDYYVAVGGSAHDAVNNVLAAKAQNGVSVDTSKMTGNPGDATKVAKFGLSFNKDKYAYSDAVSMIDGSSNQLVTNLFDFADINLYEGRGDNHTEYYSRDNWNAVSLDMANGHQTLLMTEQMAKEIFAQVPEGSGEYNNTAGVPAQFKQPIPKDDGTYPTYGEDAGLMLIDMRYDEDGNEISYFDPVWDTFMDQLTWDDTVKLVSNGWHMTEAVESVAKPETSDENGPNGFGGWAFRNGYLSNQGIAYRIEKEAGHIKNDGTFTDDVDSNALRKMTGFPANGILAATFNKQLAKEVGNMIGEDGLWAGCSGLYGIGLNLHRSPYTGRSCEYFSECGTLTGMIGAAECAGIEEKGVHVYNKHCALNDQENNRHGVGVWAPEQAIRELYLRAFEIPIEEGGAFNTMASFSRFGVQSAAACPALATDFLRGECGMKGFVITDAYQDMDGSQNIDPYYEQVYGTLVGGSDLPDGSTPATQGHFDKFKTGYSAMAWAMRQSAKRICYQTVWSSAMNGISSNTRVVSLTPWWQKALYTADIVLSLLFAASLIWTLYALIQEERKTVKKAQR